MSLKKKRKKLPQKSVRERSLILQGKAANAWLKAMTKSLRKIQELAVTPALHGEVWKEKMGRYYVGRLRAMLKLAPEGCKRDAERMKKAIDGLPW